MTNYEIGYGKPPKSTRFRKGSSGNPRGRPLKKRTLLAETIEKALTATITYDEGGVVKNATFDDAGIKMLRDRALAGDIDAAKHLLDLIKQAEREGVLSAEQIQVVNWLPEYSGQTAKQKSREVAKSRDAEPFESLRDVVGRPGEG